jgi:hypothetical protein
MSNNEVIVELLWSERYMDYYAYIIDGHVYIKCKVKDLRNKNNNIKILDTNKWKLWKKEIELINLERKILDNEKIA